MTVTHKLFKILSGHDVANGLIDGRIDRPTDGRTPYYNTSGVSLWAYNYRGHLLTITNVPTKYHDCNSESFQDIEVAWLLH